MIKLFRYLKAFFLITVYCPITAILTFNKKTKKEALINVMKPLIDYLQFNLYRVSKQTINHSNNIIYLSNHRSWADFFIDQIITEYSFKFLSRWIVAFWLPFYAVMGGYITDSIIFFKRDAKDIQYFEKLIKKNQINYSGNNILVYPEGTRRVDQNYASDLKKGIIYYSYKEKCPIQFLISKNKEIVFNEKIFRIEKHINIFVHYSDVYYPDIQKYKSMEEYYNFINSEWKTIFNSVYNTDYEENLKEYLEIDKFKIHDNNYFIDYKKIYFFRFCIISIFGLIPYFFINH
jgi:1-acyl-sn-glycerol-3-phosphate acyltransferase